MDYPTVYDGAHKRLRKLDSFDANLIPQNANLIPRNANLNFEFCEKEAWNLISV